MSRGESFGAPLGVPWARFRPQLTDTRKPEAQVTPRLPPVPRQGLEPRTY